MSPPCVGFFAGDNGGATHHGVTGEEIKVLIYMDSLGAVSTSKGYDSPPASNSIVDLANPEEDSNDFVHNRVLRVAMRYFNDRFQAYGRFVRFYVHYGTRPVTPETRRADAAHGFRTVQPFAVISYAREYGPEYIEAMAGFGVVNFLARFDLYAGRPGQAASFYQRTPGLVWSFDPALDRRAELFTSYVCTKALGYPVSFSGNVGENGRERVLGLLRNANPAFSETTAYAEFAERGIAACGGEFATTGDFQANDGGTCGSGYQAALQHMARFQQMGVTTIIWGGGIDACPPAAAGALGYRPEWLLPGDGGQDTNVYSRGHDPKVWQHARIVSSYPRGGEPSQRPCHQSAREADPSFPELDMKFYCAFYKDLRQLFTGIQVAGPGLTPESMDRGFHAIPRVASGDPYTESCFYHPGDYSCVKDAQASWWDPTTPPPGRSEAGCWRLMEDGRRYLPGQWPPGDVETQRSQRDPCNGGNGAEWT